MALRRDEGLDGFSWLQDAACRGEDSASFFPPPHFERKDVRLARGAVREVDLPAVLRHLAVPRLRHPHA